MGTVHQFPVQRNRQAPVPAEELARALRLAVDALPAHSRAFWGVHKTQASSYTLRLP